MQQLKKDILIYLALFVLSVLFYFVWIPQQIALRGSWSGDIVFTSRSFPNILVITLGGVSLLGVLTAALKMRRLAPAAPQEKQPIHMQLKGWLLPVYFFAVTMLYALMFDRLGYLVATAVIIPVYLASLKCKKWQYYLITYAVGAIIYAVFKLVLRIPL